MKLYDAERSSSCHKIRLMLSLLEIEYERVLINLVKGEQKRAEFLKLNPRGRVPVLEDEGNVIWDSAAILVYVGRKFGGETWLPTAPHAMAGVMQWLAMAQNEIRYGLARARAIQAYAAGDVRQPPTLFARQSNLEETRAVGKEALRVLEHHLSDHGWLAADHPTIADIACYSDVALAPEGGISLDEYPAICAWLTRIQRLPGYVGHENIPHANNQ